MKIIEYMREKYLLEHPTVLTAGEAKGFGIPYPLRSGWIEQHGEKEITAEMRDAAIFRLERKISHGGEASMSPYHPRALAILRGLPL